ncbi:MAG: VOC family protein [Chloroflexi bacterium]|nr:VOC family protein [Chloroflexota bacterium]
MLVEIDHIGIVARSWDEAQQVLLEKLGLELDSRRSPLPDGVYFAPERTNNYFIKVGLGQTRVEVLIPADDTSGTAKFLARNGPGLHHIGYGCLDVAEQAERLEQAGLKRIDIGPAAPGRKLGAAFFHPKSVNGILTELVPVYRP